jgi:phosphate-selective porin OprO/OprP
LLIENAAGTMSWGAGVFREADKTGKSVGSGEYNVTGRLSARLLNRDGGRRLVHFGVAGSLRRPPDDEVELASSPENHLAPDFVSTGTLAADRVVLLGLDAAAVRGPVSVQGEYVRADVSTLDGPDPACSGFYVLASWFPTGEHRPFSSSSAKFGRVKPRHPYDGSGGAGAWEIAARYSRLDLEDAGPPVLSGITAGVSWYLNPNFRWVTDYVRADVDGLGVSHAVQFRTQADF